jgi:uncharacterized protein YdhG (YjbR/CyaY superfamily)
MSDTKDAATKSARGSGGFTDAEKAAMQERAREAKAARKGSKEDGRAALLAKIAEMPSPDREMAERIHAIVSEVAPELQPRTWYGMPAYYRNGKVLCFFQAAAKFKARYATFGFDEEAKLDEGNMWPTSYALSKLTPADERRIAELVKRALG